MTAKPSAVEELLILLPIPVCVTVGRRDVSITKVRVRQLSQALLLAAPIMPSLATIDPEAFCSGLVFPLLEDQCQAREFREALVQLLALCSDAPDAFYRKLKTPALVAVATFLILENRALFCPVKPQTQTVGEVEHEIGTADAIQLLLKSGHRLENVLDYSLEQLHAYQLAAVRQMRFAQAEFVSGIAIALGCMFGEQPKDDLTAAIKSITREQ